MRTPSVLELLKYRRPARSQSESEFITRYLDSIPGITIDQYGNRLLLCESSKTMISVHTDTVHRVPGKQSIRVRKGLVSTHDTKSNCLGADDSAGIYIALRMIAAGVRATFVFHRDEEIGGRGSSWLAQNYSGWLKTFDRCIALDRRGTSDVITHQMMGRCCSDTFAQALAGAIGLSHKPSSHGIFTDSANYVGLIPECTNISIGYSHEHTTFETLDLVYLEALIAKLIKLDWAALPTCEWADDTGFECQYCGKPEAWGLQDLDGFLLCDTCSRDIWISGPSSYRETSA